jgi:hypothetical protein
MQQAMRQAMQQAMKRMMLMPRQQATQHVTARLRQLVMALRHTHRTRLGSQRHSAALTRHTNQGWSNRM